MSKARRRTNRSRHLSRSAKRHATRRILRAESLENRMLLAGDVLPVAHADDTPHHNYFRPTDVNEDSKTSAVDALLIINQLNKTGPRELGVGGGEGEESGSGIEGGLLGKVDTNGDNRLSPSDVLAVINALNAEGEPDADDIIDITLSLTDKDGNDVNGGQVQVGDTISLTASVQDLRGFQASGVFASYFDVDYNNGNLFQVDFGETQTLTFSNNISNVGTFTLTYEGTETAPIPLVGDLRTATTNNIRSALEALPGVESGDLVVAHRPSTGNADPQDDNNFIWQITYFQNLGMQDISELEVDPGNLPGIGGPVTATVVETYPADIDNENTFRLAFKPQAPYTDGLRATNSADDNRFDEIGTFSRVVPDVLTDVYPFISVDLIVQEPGTLTFSGNEAETRPDSEVLVFGSSDEVPVDMINYPDELDEIVTVDIIKPVDAFDDSFDLDEDAEPTVLDVLSNDVVITGGTKEVSAVTQGDKGGTVTISNGGDDITYEPADNVFGIETFEYTLTDGLGAFDTATVTIDLTEINDDPLATDDEATLDEDTTATIDVLANDDITPDEGTGETLSIISASSHVGATLAVNGDITYTPPTDYWGPDTVTYTISDGRGGTATANIDITVNPINDEPVASDDGVIEVDEDTSDNPIDVLTNDTVGPDNEIPLDNLQITTATTTTPGASVSIVNGTSVIYTPAPDFFGTDTFTYTIEDNGSPNLSDSATVTIDVQNVNDDPNAMDDNFNYLEDSTDNLVDVLANDVSDPDPQETLTVTSVTQPNDGSVTLTQDGDVLYTPDAGFVETSTFTYTISDGNGGTSSATVNITVDPLEIPRARADRPEVNEDSSDNVINVLENDLAHDGFTLKITAADSQSTEGGTVTFTDTSVSYTPLPDFFGTDTFTYTINEFDDEGVIGDQSDGPATTTVTINVLNLNDDPTANGDSYTFDEDSGLNNLTVLDNDVITPDADETLSITSVSSASKGTVAIASGSGSVNYTPNDDAFGDDSFTYIISDGNGGSSSATVSITIDPVNDNPTADDDSITINEDSGLNILDVLDNDTIAPDADETLTIVDVEDSDIGATIDIAGDGMSILYTPPLNFFGDDTFTYTVNDGNGGSDTATVHVGIDNVNDNPVANDDFDSDTPRLILKDSEDNLIPVVDNDSFLPDPEEDLIVTSVSGASFGTVEPSGDGKGVLYTPNTGEEDKVDTFTYVLSDQNGGSDTATVTVKIVNFVPSNVTGYSFFDSNGTAGVMDDGEFGISGTTIWLRGTNLLDENVEMSTTTDASGYFEFKGVVPGDFTLEAEQPKFLADGDDTIGEQGGTATNDRFSFNLDIFGSTANFNFFGETGVKGEFVTLQELLSSTPDEGAAVAMNGSSRYWYSLFKDWEGVSDVSVTAASNYSYIDVTATVNGNTSTNRIHASSGKYHLMGVASDGVIFRLKGSADDFGFGDDITEAEGEYYDSEKAEGESTSEEEELRMLAQNGSGNYEAAVDAIMKSYS